MELTRRSLLTAIGAVTLSGVSAPAIPAIEPVIRKGGPRMKLSLAAYSFRDYLSGSAKSMTMEDFADLAATYPLDAIEPTSYYFEETVTPEYFRRYQRRAFLNGLDISGTAIGNTFTYPPGPRLRKEIEATRKWIERAACMGAPVIRIFAGSLEKGSSISDARKWCVDAIQECCQFAGEHGVILALENHGGIVSTPDETLAIVKAVQSDWFGVNLDTGNFHGPDPYEDLARVAPYAVTVQVKTEIAPNGGPRREADFARIVGLLKKVGYRGYIALEYEGKEDAKTAVPRYLDTLSRLIS
jgi:sugar phosphate isomerase/epimerase